jgi:hypothetical protein
MNVECYVKGGLGDGWMDEFGWMGDAIYNMDEYDIL